MRGIEPVVCLALASCVGSGSHHTVGNITGNLRPSDVGEEQTDPTAGEIRVSPVMATLGVAVPAPMASTTDREIIRSTVRENLGGLIFCYERVQKDEPDLHGTVMTRFIIETDGRVRKVEAYGMEPLVAACIAETMRATLFPPPSMGRLQVVFPFTFSPPRTMATVVVDEI
jgi:hypothetical protein